MARPPTSAAAFPVPRQIKTPAEKWAEPTPLPASDPGPSASPQQEATPAQNLSDSGSKFIRKGRKEFPEPISKRAATAVKQDSQLYEINIPVILYRLSLVVVLSLSVVGIIAINGGTFKLSTIIECTLALIGGASIRLLLSWPDSLPRFDFSFLRSSPPTETGDSPTKATESTSRAADRKDQWRTNSFR